LAWPQLGKTFGVPMSDDENEEEESEGTSKGGRDKRIDWKKTREYTFLSVVLIIGCACFFFYSRSLGRSDTAKEYGALALIVIGVVVFAWAYYVLDRCTNILEWNRAHHKPIAFIGLFLIVALVTGFIIYRVHVDHETDKSNLREVSQICNDERAMLERCQIEYGAIVDDYDGPVDVLRVPLADRDMSNLDEYGRELNAWNGYEGVTGPAGSFDNAVEIMTAAHEEVKPFLEEAWNKNNIYEGQNFADAKAAYDTAISDLKQARQAIDSVKPE
jgi:predicted nucleic acid-binding Zn ribbon protein